MLGIGDLHPLLNGTGKFAREYCRALLHDAEFEFAQAADDRDLGSASHFRFSLVGLGERISLVALIMLARPPSSPLVTQASRVGGFSSEMSTMTTKRALIGPRATTIVLRYEVAEMVSTRSQPGTHGATRSGSLMKALTRSIGAGIVKCSSMFISETMSEATTDMSQCYWPANVQKGHRSVFFVK